MSTQFNIVFSKSGVPCLWEKGGGYTNTGDAQIVAGSNGEAKRPLYIRSRGTLACAEHALIPLQPGDHVVLANQHRGDFNIGVYQISLEDVEIWRGELLHEFSSGEWDSQPLEKFSAAIDAAKKKATCYHCKYACYIIYD